MYINKLCFYLVYSLERNHGFVKARVDKIRLAAEAKAAAALARKKLVKMQNEDVLSRRLAKYGTRKSTDRP